MGRARCLFKQRDVTQALKAARAAGVSVSRFEIDQSGKIIVFASKTEGTSFEGDGTLREWDDL
jgi:hypothetical protein